MDDHFSSESSSGFRWDVELPKAIATTAVILYGANFVHTLYTCVTTKYDDKNGNPDFDKIHKDKMNIMAKMCYGLGWPFNYIVERVLFGGNTIKKPESKFGFKCSCKHQ